jgi:hypothetical protein
MTRQLHITLVLLGACGSGETTPDALAGCQVELSGNVVESTSSMASCPILATGAGATAGETLLKLSVASPALGGTLTIDIDLGPQPTPGSYSSRTTALWSASAVKPVAPDGACVFIAGNNVTPMGAFTLDLASIDASTAHGTLALTMAVLPRTADDGTPTDCGPGTTEQAALRF